MKRVLVIGKNSYIAKELISYIKKLNIETQYELHGISARNEEWRHTNFSDFDVVIHMAAIVHKSEKETGEEMYRQINYELPVEIAKEAKRAKVRQFIFLSTMAVYGRTKYVNKKTPLRPTTYYGRYKAKAEGELLKLEDEHFKVAIVRPPMVYGKGCKGNFSRLVKLSSKCPILPSIRNQRSMIHIENLCEYICLLMERDCHGVGFPQNMEYISTTEMMGEIRRQMHKKLVYVDWFNPILKLMSKKNSTFNKMFGDCYYEQMSEMVQVQEYQKIDFKESIRKSL